MTIQQCRYALEIAKTGSFNQASKQLFVAQSGLSSSVKQLEKELGIQIFMRSKNGVCLTADGAEFIRYAEQIVSQSEFVQNRYVAPVQSSKLYVATQHYDFVADSFSKLISDCKEQNYDFSLREIKTYDVIREVENAYCDIGVIAIKDKDFDIMTRFLKIKNLSFFEFLRTPPHVYVKKGHEICFKKEISYDDLISFPFLSYEQGSHNASFFTEEVMDEYGGNKKITISDRATLMNVLLTTDSYTIGTGIMPSALNDGKIVGLRLNSDCDYHIGYVLKKGGVVASLTKKFIEILLEFAQEYQK